MSSNASSVADPNQIMEKQGAIYVPKFKLGRARVPDDWKLASRFMEQAQNKFASALGDWDLRITNQHFARYAKVFSPGMAFNIDLCGLEDPTCASNYDDRVNYAQTRRAVFVGYAGLVLILGHMQKQLKPGMRIWMPDHRDQLICDGDLVMSPCIHVGNGKVDMCPRDIEAPHDEDDLLAIFTKW